MQHKFLLFCIIIILGIFVGYKICYFFNIEKSARVCFTPPERCAKVIASEIENAKFSIYAQLYDFKADTITMSLIKAQNRGVKVKVILGEANLAHAKLDYIRTSGLAYYIDKMPSSFGNKALIIDEATVITGGFSYSKNKRGVTSESVVIINDKKLAARYYQNWLRRKKQNETSFK